MDRLIVFVFIIAVSASFLSCENDIAKVKIITAKDNIPVESATEAEIIFSDSAIIKVKITAPKLDRYSGEKPHIELPEGIHVLFFDDSLNVESELTADYAINYESENRMEAKGNVILINKKGEKLNTEHLIWDEKKSLIYTNEFVKITTADEIIMGEGFESNQNFTKFKIKKIKGTIAINE